MAESEHPGRERVYRFIVSYKTAHDGNSPTIRQISAACWYCTSVVFYHLDHLEKAGLIRRPVEGKRAAAQIEVTGGQWTLTENKENNEQHL